MQTGRKASGGFAFGGGTSRRDAGGAGRASAPPDAGRREGAWGAGAKPLLGFPGGGRGCR